MMLLLNTAFELQHYYMDHTHILLCMKLKLWLCFRWSIIMHNNNALLDSNHQHNNFYHMQRMSGSFWLKSYFPMDGSHKVLNYVPCTIVTEVFTSKSWLASAVCNHITRKQQRSVFCISNTFITHSFLILKRWACNSIIITLIRCIKVVQGISSWRWSWIIWGAFT